MRGREPSAGRFPGRAWSLALLLAVLQVVGSSTGVAAQSPAGPGSTGEATLAATVVDEEGRGLAGIGVLLEVHDGQTFVHREEGVTDESGRVRYTGVPAGDSHVARIGAEYAGVTYYADAVRLTPGSSAEAEVRVAEVTSEGRPLHLDTLHIIIQAEDPTFYRVLQFVTVSNAAGAAWAGGPELADGRPAGIVIPVPTAARSVQPAPFPSAADALPVDAIEIGTDRVLDPRPVPPAGRQAALTYELVTGDDPVDVALPLPYPTQSVSVLLGGVGAGGAELTDTNLEQRPAEQIGEERYELWGAEGLDPGTTIRFRIGPRSEGLPPWGWGLAGLGLALLVAVVASQRSAPGTDRLLRERDALVREVARLDLAHADGRLDRGEYHRQRAAKLERLVVLYERLGDEAEAGEPDRSGPKEHADGPRDGSGGGS